MLRNQFRLARYLAPIALVASISMPMAFAQKKKTRIVPVVGSPLTYNLTADKDTVLACADGGAQQVRLNANAVSPGGFPIKYKWTTDAGTISGEGPVVTWNLAGLTPGYHKATLDLQSVGADGSCQAFSSVSVLVKPCVAVQPVCPAIEISCPTDVAINQPLTFTSRYSGGIPANVTPVFNWTVSAGTIISGQGTDTIRVDTNGLAGQTVRASLSMGGYNLECSAECAVSIPLPEEYSKKFDEFPDISRNDEKARLDNYAIQLQSDPKATGYVIIYPGRSTKPGDVQRHAKRIVDYLVNSRGLDQSRIVTLVGPVKDDLVVELWITPQGVKPPNP